MSLGQQVNDAALSLYLSGKSLAEAERLLKRAFLEEVLRDCRGNQLHAAAKLGWHRNTLTRALNELGLDPSRFYTDQKRNGPPHRPAQRVLAFAQRNGSPEAPCNGIERRSA
jgi:hypothetical protein